MKLLLIITIIITLIQVVRVSSNFLRKELKTGYYYVKFAQFIRY